MWQNLRTSNGTFYMIHADYDDRDFYKSRNESFVKVLAFYENRFPENRLFCQLWFEGLRDPVVSEVSEITALGNYNHNIQNVDGFSPFFITCLNPFAYQNLIPSSVSVVESKCDKPINNFPIIQNLPKSNEKKPLAVCLKLLNYTNFDNEMMVIEWIEIMLVLGVDKIIVSAIDIHPKIFRILKYYESVVKVELLMMTLPKNIPKLEAQITENDKLIYTDCFYRHMFEYKFIIPIDIDELIIPNRAEDKTLVDLLNRVIDQGKVVQKNLYASYVAQQSLFLLNNNHKNEIQKEVPDEFHFLQHIYRAKLLVPFNESPKSFINTDIVTVLNQHLAIRCNGMQNCSHFDIDPSDATTHHYREKTPWYFEKFDEEVRLNTTRDISLWKYKDEIIRNVHKTVVKLKSFSIS